MEIPTKIDDLGVYPPNFDMTNLTNANDQLGRAGSWDLGFRMVPMSTKKGYNQHLNGFAYEIVY